MRPGGRSRTAEATAFLRALHRVLDDRPLVLDDPFAARLLPPRLRFLLVPLAAGRRARRRWEAAVDRRSPRFPFASRQLRAQVLVRSRWAEERFDHARAGAIGRHLILAAGLDTFALRRATPQSEIEVIEVDHPATQRWKRSRLRAARLPVGNDRWRLVPCDFERRTLSTALRQAGVENHEPLFVSWLGASYYLSREALVDTLAFVAEQAGGSELALDYWCEEELPAADRVLLDSVRLSVASQGEPMLSLLDRRTIARLAREHGLLVVEELSSAETAKRYLAGRRDGLELPAFARLVALRKG